MTVCVLEPETETQLQVATESMRYFLGGPLDGEETESDKEVLWVSLPTKKKGLVALYELENNKYIYKKTIEGYPNSKKTYTNLIVASIRKTEEPINWMDYYWRMWTTKKDY